MSDDADWDRAAFLAGESLPPHDESTRGGREAVLEYVDRHGEAYVLDHYYMELYHAGRIVGAMPRKEDLPFFDPDEHEAMDRDEVIELYRMMAEYRENLRSGTKPGEDS